MSTVEIIHSRVGGACILVRLLLSLKCKEVYDCTFSIEDNIASILHYNISYQYEDFDSDNLFAQKVFILSYGFCLVNLVLVFYSISLELKA